MNQGRYIEKTLLTIGLILIFSSSPISFIEKFEYLSNYLFYFGGMFVITVAFSSIMKREVFFDTTLKLFTYLYGGFISLMILSIIVNQSLAVEVYSLERFISVFLFLGIGLALIDVISEKLIINSLIISLGIIFIYILFESPIFTSDLEVAYSGSFSNSGTFGEVAVTFAIVSLIAGTSLLKLRQNFFLAILYLLITVGVSYLVIISGSRTSFITLIIILGIVLTTYFYDMLKSRNLLTWKSVLIIILLAFGGASLLIFIDNPIYGVIESNIIDKFKRKIENTDITDGRVELWLSIIKDINLFGEVKYFEDHIYPHAHNSFLEIMILNGLFAGIAYIIFWITIFIKSIQHYLTEKITNVYAILPLVIVTNFILLSMTEIIQFHISTFLALSMVAILSKPKDNL